MKHSGRNSCSKSLHIELQGLEVLKQADYSNSKELNNITQATTKTEFIDFKLVILLLNKPLMQFNGTMSTFSIMLCNYLTLIIYKLPSIMWRNMDRIRQLWEWSNHNY
ncbi:hypothetical protein KQX54_011370 [Cotesia glomerata]|uniref:Uncharacterized protein n=1 Tax=Cotesia glomerata TaxID=32391 RepID=A0AAV7ID29_COTGL|nr:hypothetical protein KQX54_011370 [Cotesia glomerata]